jgi:hypothetical protein
MRDFDFESTYINLLTATEPGVVNTREGSPPVAMPSDKEAMAIAIESSLGGEQPRICRIKSTAMLDEFWISEALVPETKLNSDLTLIDAAQPMEFNNQGNLF